MVGLRAGEVPIIAHRGEMIIPEEHGRPHAGRQPAGGDTHITDNSRHPHRHAATGMVAADSDDGKQFGQNVQKADPG